MKNVFKKSISILLVVVMIFGSAPLAGLVGLELPSLGELFSFKAKAATSGTCGENLTWDFDELTGTLTISGTGDMDNWSYLSPPPWDDIMYNVNKIIIDERVTSIGNYSFCGFSKVTNINIPNNVTNIGDGAFRGTGIESVEISKNVTNIGLYAFRECYKLKAIIVDKDNSKYCSDEFGVLYDKDKTTLHQFNIKNTCTHYQIPDSVTKIVSCAFENNKIIKTLIIPNGIKKIDIYTFSECELLEKIVLPNSLTDIYAYAFYDCSSLTDVYFTGSSEEWDTINISSRNESLLNAKFHYFYGLTMIRWIIDEIETVDFVSAGDNIITPKDPVKEGYVFLGWTPTVPTIMPNQSLRFEAVWEVITNTCGNNLTWTFDEYTETLTISGTGEMTNWSSSSDVPWSDYSSAIKKVIVSDGVTSIGEYAFSDCTNLASVTIGDSVTSIGDSAFYYCTSLRSVAIPDGITSIGNNMFDSCENLTSITIPDSVTKIGDSAFNYCINLRNIIIPDGVTSIGSYAFYGCGSLTSIEIPDSVTSIGDYAFYECANISSITVGVDNPSYSSDEHGVLFNKDKTELIQYPIGSITTSYIISDSVINIHSDAFFGCNNLTTVTIGASVTRIEDGAFYECYSLTNVIIPDSVTSIGRWVFFGCSSLESISIPDSVTSIGERAFYGCNSLSSISVDTSNPSYSSDEHGVLFNKDKTELIQYPIGNTRTSYVIPDSVTNISDYAFEGCATLTSITIPDSVTNIGRDAFYNTPIYDDNTNWEKNVLYIDDCLIKAKSSLSGAYSVKDGTRVIADNAFYSCRSLTSVTIGNSVISIGDYSFTSCVKLSSVIIGNGVTSIGDVAFSYCDNLTNVTIGNSVTRIGKYAFSNCTNLASVTIPNSVTSIGESAFGGTAFYKDSNNWESDVLYVDNCLIQSKTSISGAYSIKDGTRVIADNAFFSCRSLTSIEIPDSLTSIGESVFNYCTSLTGISVNSDNSSYSNDEQGVLFDKNKTVLIQYPAGNSSLSYAIPDSVTIVGDRSFSSCDALTNVTIPDGVTSVGIWAFYNCGSLTSIKIPASVTSIGFYAFNGCTSLTDVYYTGSPEKWNLITIGMYNDSLHNAKLHFDSSYLNGTCGENITWTFDDVTGTLVLTGNGKMPDWTASTPKPWSGFKNLIRTVVLDDEITSISDYAFYNCSNLTNITIPNGITYIGYCAFSGCKSLEEVNIPDSVTTIEDSAFNSCTSLAEITLPNHALKIDRVAFGNTAYYNDESNWENGVLYIGNHLIVAKDYLAGEYIVKDGTLSIAGHGFYLCEQLTNVVMPDSVEYIGISAFLGCSSIKNLKIPTKVTTLCREVFGGCTSLSSVRFSKNITQIEKWAFNDCENLTDVYFVGSSDDWDNIIIAEGNEYLNNANIHYQIRQVTWIVDGESTTYNAICGEPIIVPERPEKDGYKFIGWTPEVPAIMPEYDLSFTAVWQRIYNIEFPYETIDIQVCGTKQLDIVISPETEESLDIIWSSNNKSVAVVDENGFVSAISCGSAVITAEYDSKIIFVTVNVTHKYNSNTTNATCTQNGFTTYTCTACGDVYTDNVIEAKGHSYSQTKVESSCTGIGYTKYECSVCGDTYTDNETPANGHKYDSITIKPTCTSGGYTINMCSVCGHAYKSDLIDALGHSYLEKIVNSTCVSEGYTEHTCLNCGDYFIDNTIGLGEHNYIVTKIVEANCSESGYTEHTCSVCSNTFTDNMIDALGHNFISVVTVPTCSNEGYTLNTCDVCGFSSITDKISPLGHEYISKLVPATCEVDGYTMHTCVRGDHVYTSDDVPAFGHEFESLEIVTTCIQRGCTLDICLNCGRVNKSNETEAYGHTFAEWITVTEPSEDTEGLETRNCKRCRYTEEKILPMLQRTTYTATFVADGNVVSYVEFLKDTTEIIEPEVPQKHRYIGEWEKYTLTNSDITINAEYTLVDLDTLSGIDFRKNASYNSTTGEATISLYASSDAETIISTSSKRIPLDIVLVVDQSGSMAEKFSGNVSKQDALIESATEFVNSVYADASANGVDHRIAVVGFGMGNKSNGYGYPAYLNTEILTTGGNPISMKNAKSSDYASALMSVNNNGTINANIVNAINSIDAKGATAADYGLSMANNVFANNSDTEGRQRIVIFMTDGEPTYSSGFANNVANAAVQQAYQLKNTYGATVYSVGIFNSSSDKLTKFMNYVSSNCDDAKSASGNFDIDSEDFFVMVDDADALSNVFTEIIVENVTTTTDFDNLTLIDTVSKYFTLTTQQEKALRISAIEKFGIKNSDITITRNADGTTTIIIKSVNPVEKGNKFVAELGFKVSANENASTAGNYATNTEDAGIIVGDSENYECIFNVPTVNIPSDRNTVVFKVNGEVYAIRTVAPDGRITAPETDFIGDYKFTGWNIPEGTVANQPVMEFDSTLVNQDCVVIWNTDSGTETVTYAPGDVIDIPDVTPDRLGDAFRRWNGEVPVTMPAESIEFTAVYGDHEHKYLMEIVKVLSCVEDGQIKYTCSVCDKSYIETVECAGEHNWKAITGPADKYGHATESFKCEVCGVSDEKTLEYMLVAEADGAITQEFNYVDENGNLCQPDDELTITVPLDEYSDANSFNVYRVNEDGTKTLCESRYADGVLEFDTNHFSTYIFEPVYQCMIQGNHPDSNDDGNCDICRKWLGVIVTWVIDGKETKVKSKPGTELVKPENPEKEGYTFIGWTPAVLETVPEYDVTYTAVFEVNTYTVKWFVEGKETTETYEYGSEISIPVRPEKDGYFFAGWTPAVPLYMPAKDMIFTAKFADYDVSKIKVTIATPETRTIAYRESITLYANVTHLPEGARIKWSADNNCVNIETSNGGKTCTVTSKSNGNVVITAYVVDANGNVITNEKGVRISDCEGLTSEVTFWSLIVYMFKQIFSGNPFLKFIFQDLFN